MTFYLKSNSHLKPTHPKTVYFYPPHPTLTLKFPILQMVSLFLSLNPESSFISVSLSLHKIKQQKLWALPLNTSNIWPLFNSAPTILGLITIIPIDV